MSSFISQTLHVCHMPYMPYIDPQNHPNVSIYGSPMECLGISLHTGMRHLYQLLPFGVTWLDISKNYVNRSPDRAPTPGTALGMCVTSSLCFSSSFGLLALSHHVPPGRPTGWQGSLRSQPLAPRHSQPESSLDKHRSQPNRSSSDDSTPNDHTK